jgi:hypothetical protein
MDASKSMKKREENREKEIRDSPYLNKKKGWSHVHRVRNKVHSNN